MGDDTGIIVKKKKYPVKSHMRTGAKPGPKDEKLTSASMGEKGSNSISWIEADNQSPFIHKKKKKKNLHVSRSMETKRFLLKNKTSNGSHKNPRPKTLNSTIEKKKKKKKKKQ